MATSPIWDLVEWLWSSGGSNESKPSVPDAIEENWEFLTSSKIPSTDSESPNIQDAGFVKQAKKTPVGFYSLITVEQVRRFLFHNLEIVACYWPEDPNHGSRGSLKVFRNSCPPGWSRLSELVRLPTESFQKPWAAIITAELTRLRTLELRDPHSCSIEFTTPLLQGLLLYLPFHVFVWRDIAVNPYTDLVITLPLERLYDRTQTAYPWRESIDSIITLLADRTEQFPPLIVHLIPPRLSVVKSQAEVIAARAQANACGKEYQKWVDISFFQVNEFTNQ